MSKLKRVIVDGVLTLEYQYAAGPQNAERLADGGGVISQQFLVRPVPGEPAVHYPHLAGFDVRQKRRVQDHVLDRTILKRQIPKVSLLDKGRSWNQVEAQLRPRQVLPETAVPIGRVQLKAGRAMQLPDSQQDFVLRLVNGACNVFPRQFDAAIAVQALNRSLGVACGHGAFLASRHFDCRLPCSSPLRRVFKARQRAGLRLAFRQQPSVYICRQMRDDFRGRTELICPWAAQFPAPGAVFLERFVTLAVEPLVTDFRKGQADLQEGFQPSGNRDFGTPKSALFPRREGRLVSLNGAIVVCWHGRRIA